VKKERLLLSFGRGFVNSAQDQLKTRTFRCLVGFSGAVLVRREKLEERKTAFGKLDEL